MHRKDYSQRAGDSWDMLCVLPSASTADSMCSTKHSPSFADGLAYTWPGWVKPQADIFQT